MFPNLSRNRENMVCFRNATIVRAAGTVSGFPPRSRPDRFRDISSPIALKLFDPLGDDDVVVHHDAQGAARVHDILSHGDVAFGRRWVAAWVVMHQNQGGGFSSARLMTSCG